MALLLVLLVAIVGALVGWCYHGAAGYYAYQPGTAPELTTSSACRLQSGSGALALPGGTPCARLSVPAGRAHRLQGRLLMVDVLVGPASPIQYFLDKVGLLGTFQHGTTLVPAAEVLGSAPASQLSCQDNLEMSGATLAAPVVALQHLGYSVRVVQHGAQVFLVQPRSAAARAGVHCGDVIIAVAGRAVRTAQGLTAAVRSHRPGQRISITVRRAGAHDRSHLVTLHATLGRTPAEGGEPARPHSAFLGVAIEDDTTFTLPFHVGIDVGDIGGPSAGLAMTLALLDTLSSGRLTGGHTVAATGTIATNGAVGPVGGVAQKAVAVSRAGATLFLVPPSEVAAARSTAGPHLRVEGVSSLQQALRHLRAIGGQIPAAHPSR